MNTFNVFTGVLGSGGRLTATKITVSSPMTFKAVTSGSNAFTTCMATTSIISGSAATLNLQAGTVNTAAIVPNSTSGGFRLINIPRC